MKKSILTIMMMLLLSAMGAEAKKLKCEKIAIHDFDEGMLNLRKEEMLSTCDELNYWSFEDEELQEIDPHAYWLMQRMMDMMRMIETADDGMAWLLAMYDCIDEYNCRLGRYVEDEKYREMAIHAVELLPIQTSSASSYMENITSYIRSITAHYRVLDAYYQMISRYDDDEVMADRLYSDYYMWFDFNNACNALLEYYKYAPLHYVMKSSDITGTFAEWSRARAEEVAMERYIVVGIDEQETKERVNSLPGKHISPERFLNLIDSFVGLTKEEIIERMTKKLNGNREWAEESYQNSFSGEDVFDVEAIEEMALLCKHSYWCWYQHRYNIADELDAKQAKLYRQMTEAVNYRLYKIMEDICIINV
ncbi:MAG: hypothetical protein J6B41_06065 [Alistipes sp.]|nr:hypothetical protein [Alistipes sp.]